MKYEYSIHGPFKIKTYKGAKHNKALDPDIEAKKKFWDDVEKKEANLPTACGCYLFAIKTKGFKPWYVGLAGKGFQKECLARHKIIIYTQVLNKYVSGTPILFLIAKRTKERGDFAKPSKNVRPDIKSLENMLISAAIVKNRDLMNKKQTKYLREMRVPGLMHTLKKKPTDDEKQFKKTIK